MKLTKLSLSIVLALQLSPLNAVENNDDSATDESDYQVITITSSRLARNTDEVSNTVSVISAKEMEKQSAKNIKDLVRYEPGVSVDGGGRYGLSGFKIRGIDGDRVLTLIDGSPIADEFSFGPNLSARRDFVDLDALKAVEIVRGSSSSLYGSNAVGGTVSFITKDPEDYFAKDRNHYVSYKAGFSSVDEGQHHTLTLAAGDHQLQGMLIGTFRDLSETKTYFDDNLSGSERKASDPMDSSIRNYYAKLIYRPTELHQFKLIAENFVGKSESDILSSTGSIVFGTLKRGVSSEDERSRDRFSLQYTYENPSALFDQLNLNLYQQESRTSQMTLEDRLAPANINQTRHRDSSFEQENLGIKLQLNKEIPSQSDFQQFISYGIDWDKSKSNTLRSGSTINSDTGEPIAESSNFPTRDFPNSDYLSSGLFIQNEIHLLDGSWRLIPSLRYDQFELKPKVDAIYLSGNTGSPTPAPYQESEVSFKLGSVYQLNQQWSWFAQYSEGFKAPPMDAVNTGFTNFSGGYTTLPNPDLKAEISKSYETGIRRYSDSGFFEATIYQNKYDHFIESLSVKGFNPATGLLEFQATNLDEATIEGLEIKGQHQLSTLSDSLKNLSFRFAYAYSQGEQAEAGTPLNSIDPQQLVSGLSYDASDSSWGSSLMWTLTQAKKQADIDASGIQARTPGAPVIESFESPSSSVIDWIGYYDFNSEIHLTWGIYNLTDKKYWQWGEGLVQDSTAFNADRLTQPGRNYSVNLKVEF